MVKSWALLLIVSWILVLVPAACLSGVLGHGCADHGEDLCGHETNCSDDPCHTFTPPLKSRFDDEPLPANDMPLLDPAGATAADFDCDQRRSGVRTAPDPTSLPVPAAALPLLC